MSAPPCIMNSKITRGGEEHGTAARQASERAPLRAELTTPHIIYYF